MKSATAYLDFDLTIPRSDKEVAEESVLVSSIGPWSKWATRLTFLFADLIAFAFILWIMQLVWNGSNTAGSTIPLLPIVAFHLALFGLFGLYSATALHPARELQHVVVNSTVFFVALLGMTWLRAGISSEALSPLVTMWFLTIVFVPMQRVLMRAAVARRPWWGTPVLVFATKDLGASVIRTLNRWPELGLKAVGIMHDDPQEMEVSGVPVVGSWGLAPRIARENRIPIAIVALDQHTNPEHLDKISLYTRPFERVLVVPALAGASALWTATSTDVLASYKVQNRKWLRWNRVIKRLFDVVFSFIGLVLLSPIVGAIMILIKLDSPGPIFFRQLRMGAGGRCFNVLKFRTMHQDAESKLQEILDANPVLKQEYSVYHKLQDDPRITRMGRFLRRSSLDELPQLWNVLVGDLSLVGPRAYTVSEISSMEGLERIILQNKPGVTGLWQVSGRNALSFEERVHTDVHYVHNWTFWLDLYILHRTIHVVLTGEGAC